jgi:hypothetical protein
MGGFSVIIFERCALREARATATKTKQLAKSQPKKKMQVLRSASSLFRSTRFLPQLRRFSDAPWFEKIEMLKRSNLTSEVRKLLSEFEVFQFSIFPIPNEATTARIHLLLS